MEVVLFMMRNQMGWKRQMECKDITLRQSLRGTKIGKESGEKQKTPCSEYTISPSVSLRGLSLLRFMPRSETL